MHAFSLAALCMWQARFRKPRHFFFPFSQGSVRWNKIASAQNPSIRMQIKRLREACVCVCVLKFGEPSRNQRIPVWVRARDACARGGMPMSRHACIDTRVHTDVYAYVHVRAHTCKLACPMQYMTFMHAYHARMHTYMHTFSCTCIHV